MDLGKIYGKERYGFPNFGLEYKTCLDTKYIIRKTYNFYIYLFVVFIYFVSAKILSL